MKKTKRGVKLVAVRFVALILSLALLLSTSGCLSFLLINAIDVTHEENTWQQDIIFVADGDFNHLSFIELCDLIFEHEVIADSLTLNQLVDDPEALGITVPRPATLGEYSLESTQEDNRFYKEILEALTGGHAINVAALDKPQQLEAEYLEKVLRLELRLEDFFYYFEPLKPSTGAPAMLPLSLMDYNFRTVDDIDIYLEVLEDIPNYFAKLLAHEEHKKELGLLMSLESMQTTADEALAYTLPAEMHILVSAFDEMLDMAWQEAKEMANSGEYSLRVDSLASLTLEELQEYKDQNYAAVENYVIPSYVELYDAIKELEQYCTADMRLYDYPRGTEFYELTMESQGFIEGAASAAATLDAALDRYIDALVNSSDAGFFNTFIPESVVQSIGDRPEDYLAYIQEHAGVEFASAGDLNYRIKQAPDASPNEYAMAYFLIPPVDDPHRNIIVFFPNNISDDVEFFSTMAHEGYPGHMYQVYAYSLENPTSISKILGSSAYMEGWAMYSQARAMRFLDYDANTIEMYSIYEKFAYGLQARVDIGINFEGWTLKDTERYLERWGYQNAARSLYSTCIKQPVAYLPYGLGLIEFDEMRVRAESELASHFDPVAYHQKITSLGALPFDMLEREMEAWFRTSGAQQL